jgi:hypothetical protein
LMVWYHLGNLDVALTMARRSENAIDVVPAAQLAPFQAFYDGLTALAILRENQNLSFSGRRKLISRGRRCLKMLRNYSKHCQENYYQRVLFLEGEFAALSGKLELAMSKYAMAEELAGREGYLDLQGLACERAGLTLRQFGRKESEVTKFLERSIRVYTKWGAFAKVDRTKRLLMDG